MIVITNQRSVGGLADHLGLTGEGSNDSVTVREELLRSVPADANLAMRLMAGVSRATLRNTHDFWHVIFSPGGALDDDKRRRLLNAYEAEFGIPASVYRHVTEHVKDSRPDHDDREAHLHVLYSAVDPETGRALRYRRFKERDELVARTLELEFDEPLTPSVRVDRLVAILKERGQHALAHKVAQCPRAEVGLRPDKPTVQAAARLDVPLKEVDEQIRIMWQIANGDLRRFKAKCAESGFAFAKGHTVVMLVHIESGLETPLVKHVNRVTKAEGDRAGLQERDVLAAMPELQPLAIVRKQTKEAGLTQSAADVLREFDRLGAEMDLDGQAVRAKQIKAAGSKLAQRLSDTERRTLKERQIAIRQRYRLRDRLRRIRVQRAFLAAHILGSADTRKIAFVLAAGAIILTGAGLVAALTGAGIAVAMLPNKRQAHQVKREVDREAQIDRGQMAADMSADAKAFFRDRAAMLKAQQRAEAKIVESRRASETARRQRAEQDGAAARQRTRAMDDRLTQMREQRQRQAEKARRRRDTTKTDGGQSRRSVTPQRQRERGPER